jgi:hypothetical protein
MTRPRSGIDGGSTSTAFLDWMMSLAFALKPMFVPENEPTISQEHKVQPNQIEPRHIGRSSPDLVNRDGRSADRSLVRVTTIYEGR